MTTSSTFPKPLQLGKNDLATARRLTQTASIAGLSALRVAKGEKPDAYLLKETFEKLGVTYIKLGQFIASTPSLFPKDYVLAFADCLDKTTPVSFATIEAVLREELQHIGTLEEIFYHIDPVALASASIAQVHKATLKTGQTVALKVQKPNVSTVIQTDLGVLQGTFWTLEKLMPSFRFANLAPIMAEIKKRMLAETDFVAESNHLKRFHQFLTSSQIDNITAPTVIDKLTTKRVLTMSFLDGTSLIDEAALAQLTDPALIMHQVLDTWFLSLMTTGEFHADLHAGNLMLLKDGRIGFLDFGLMGEIKPKSLQACFLLVDAMQKSDFVAVANAMIDIGMTHEHIDANALANDLQRLLGTSKHSATSVRAHADSLHTLMVELVEIGKRHGIHFPRDFALLTKQLLYFDRFMVTLAPEMTLFDDGRMRLLENDNSL